MPSSCPRMAPDFAGLQDRFVDRLIEASQDRLPEPDCADIGPRDWVEVSKRSIGADVEIFRPRGPQGPAECRGAVLMERRPERFLRASEMLRRDRTLTKSSNPGGPR